VKWVWIATTVVGLLLPGRGAFAVEAPSYDDYASVLSAYVSDDGLVDYAELAAHREPLDAFLASVAYFEPDKYDTWKDSDKIAFWLNAYNALTLKTVIDQYPIKPAPGRSVYPADSIRQIPGVWDRKETVILQRPMTLNAIEHDVLRREFEEPRVHVALVCGALSCPPLRAEPYRGSSLDAQLDDQTRRFLSDVRNFHIDRDRGEVWVSQLFEWYAEDFLGGTIPVDREHPEAMSLPAVQKKALLAFVPGYVSAADAEYLRTATYRLLYVDYDWSLNEQQK
jgi:hypothetical protein